jgi:hypothetical protein
MDVGALTTAQTATVAKAAQDRATATAKRRDEALARANDRVSLSSAGSQRPDAADRLEASLLDEVALDSWAARIRTSIVDAPALAATAQAHSPAAQVFALLH